MLASFLLPTRGRVTRLQNALDSLEKTCIDIDCYEALLRVDEDDAATMAYVTNNQRPNIRVTVGPQGKGYLDLHHMCNELCTQARGEFIVLYNDDAAMLTYGWDNVLKNLLPDSPKVYKPSSPGHSRNIFPIVRRAIYDVMGRFSESALNDFYISTVAKKCRIECPLSEIQIEHDHPFQGGSTIDQTYLDAVKACGVCKHDDKNEAIIACLNEDIQKVKDMLNRR